MGKQCPYGINVDRVIMGVAGTFVLVSALLGRFVHENILFFTMFVGINMLQSSLTRWCPLAIILKRAGVQPGRAYQ